MKFEEAKIGRVFVIRLEDGEILHEQIEKFARENKINRASLLILGGADKGSILITGPRESRTETIDPMETALNDTHEAVGVGTVFPDEEGNPVLHMHISCGRSDKVITGCVRKGVKAWHFLEIILTEITDCNSIRKRDILTGFNILEP